MPSLPRPYLRSGETGSCGMADGCPRDFTVRVRGGHEGAASVTRCERLARKGAELPFGRQPAKAFQIVASQQQQWFDFFFYSKDFVLCAIQHRS